MTKREINELAKIHLDAMNFTHWHLILLSFAYVSLGVWVLTATWPAFQHNPPAWGAWLLFPAIAVLFVLTPKSWTALSADVRLVRMCWNPLFRLRVLAQEGRLMAGKYGNVLSILYALSTFGLLICFGIRAVLRVYLGY